MKKQLLPSPPSSPPKADRLLLVPQILTLVSSTHRKRKIIISGPEAQKKLKEGVLHSSISTLSKA